LWVGGQELFEYITTVSGDIVAQIGGGGLPAGAEKNLLVHNGVDWEATTQGIFTALSGEFTGSVIVNEGLDFKAELYSDRLTISGISDWDGTPTSFVANYNNWYTEIYNDQIKAWVSVAPGYIDVYGEPNVSTSAGLYLDGLYCWDETASQFTWVTNSGIWFPDGTFQSTAPVGGGGVTQEQLTTTSGDIIAYFNEQEWKWGTATFSGQTGSTIYHNVNTTNHSTSITPGGTDDFSVDNLIKIGEIYVKRGANSDIVYTTGSGSLGQGFSWMVGVL
jgi:hypothetical protein